MFGTDSIDARGFTLRDRVRSASIVGIAVIVGSMLGFVAGADALLVHRVSFADFDLHRKIPFVLTLVFTAAVALAFACVALERRLFARRFDLALVGILAAASMSGIGGTLEATDFVIPAVLLLWLFAAMVEQRPIRVPLVAIVLVLLFSACCIGSIANGGIKTVLDLKSPAKVLLLAFLVADLLEGRQRVRLAVRWFVILALVSAAVAVFTGVLDATTGIPLTAWDDVRFQEKVTPFGRLMRATAFTATAQVLAHFLLLGTALLLPLRVRGIWKIAGLLLLAAGIAWTWSVGAYVLFGATVLIWLFLSRPERSVHYAAALIGLVTLAYVVGVGNSAWSRGLTDLGAEPAQDRVVQLRAVIGAIAEHPILGNGVGDRLRGAQGSIHVHNSYLEAAAEVGIPGALVLIGMLAALALGAAVLVRRLSTREDRDLCKGVLLGVFVLACHWMVEPFLDCPVSWVFIGIATGVLAHYSRELRNLHA